MASVALTSMFRRLSAAVAGCYAAVQFHLFKPSDILGPFLECVGGNPAYVDAEYEIVFVREMGSCYDIASTNPCDSSGAEVCPFL